jgi:hypothetical protein
VNRLLRLYPQSWRSRYEDELVELLELRPPTVRDRVDLVRGAVDAHLHPQVVTPEGRAPLAEEDRLPRRLGIAAVGGAALWAIAFAVSLLGPVHYDGSGAYRDGSAAFPFLLGAIGLLGAGLGGQVINLPRDAWVARAGAGVALLFLIGWGVQPWLLPLAGAMVGGMAILSLGAYRARAWPVRTSAAVILSCAAVTALIAFGYATSVDRMTGGLLLAAGAAALLPAWLVVGTTLMRQPA